VVKDASRLTRSLLLGLIIVLIGLPFGGFRRGSWY